MSEILGFRQCNFETRPVVSAWLRQGCIHVLSSKITFLHNGEVIEFNTVKSVTAKEWVLSISQKPDHSSI